MSMAVSAMSFMSQFDEYTMSAVMVPSEPLDVDNIIVDVGDKLGAVSVNLPSYVWRHALLSSWVSLRQLYGVIVAVCHLQR